MDLAKERIVNRDHWNFKMRLLEAIGFPYEVEDEEALARIHNAIIARDALIADLEAERDRLKALLTQHTEAFSRLEADYFRVESENARLRAWKESALEQLNALPTQEIGELLSVRWGDSVSDKILPALKALAAERDRLRAACEIALRALRSTNDNEAEIHQLKRVLGG